MRCANSGDEIEVGERVSVENGVKGVVVCDFDKKKCLPGYEDWLFGGKLVAGGTLSHGVMIETGELGMLYYEAEDDSIKIDKT